MPPSGGVPSSSLLRFLRSAVQRDSQRSESSFFTANTCKPRRARTRLARITSPSCPAASAPALTAGEGMLCFSSAPRYFSTSHPHRATVEASLLNLDFLAGVAGHVTRVSLKRPGAAIGNGERNWLGRSNNNNGDAWLSSAKQMDSLGRRRFFATGDFRTWMQRLAYMSRDQSHKDKDGLGPEHLSPGAAAGAAGGGGPGGGGMPPALSDPTGTIFGRTKAAAELRLRCTEFDENGNVVLVNGEFKKSELIAKYGLQPRDLRKIDSSLLPSVLVRPSSILINLLHLRVLIQHNRVLIFDAWGSSNTYAQSVFMYDLEGKLTSKESLPYEFRALEAVLISVTSGLEGEYEGIREPVVRVLRELEEDIDRDKLRLLLVYSKKLGTFEQKARLVRDAIDALLEEDEDLSDMYLTEKSKGVMRDEEDHNEVEMLLESYHKVTDEIVQNSGNLVTNIRNTEEIVKAILDANRNALMLLDLKFSIGTLGIGSGAFVAALYGMNLKNFIEESDFGFWGVSGVSAIFTAIVCVYGMQKLRKVQRVRMWSEQGLGERGNWRELDSTAGLPGEKRAERMKRLKEERAAVWKMRKETAENLRKRR